MSITPVHVFSEELTRTSVELTELLRESITSKPEMFQQHNLMDYVLGLMQTIGAIDGMTGVQKKRAVINILQDAIDGPTSGSTDMNPFLWSAITDIVPHVIDMLVGVQKGRIVINPTTKKLCMRIPTMFKGICCSPMV